MGLWIEAHRPNGIYVPTMVSRRIRSWDQPGETTGGRFACKNKIIIKMFSNRTVQRGLRVGMTNVHVYGSDVDLFKRVFWGKMPQAANPWHAYHDCMIDLIQIHSSYRED